MSLSLSHHDVLTVLKLVSEVSKAEQQISVLIKRKKKK